MWEYGGLEGDNTFICNPITQEYFILPKQKFHVKHFAEVRHGFGVSMTGEYKVIRIYQTTKSS